MDLSDAKVYLPLLFTKISYQVPGPLIVLDFAYSTSNIFLTNSKLPSFEDVQVAV